MGRLSEKMLMMVASGSRSRYIFDNVTNGRSAYSLRKLSRTYAGSCLTLRRGSDNAEADFGFVSDYWVDVSAITTWLGGADGYVKTWFDQVSTYNLSQTDTALQPKFVLDYGGKPNILYTIASGTYLSNAAFNPDSNVTSIFSVIQPEVSAAVQRICELARASNDGFILSVETTKKISSAATGNAGADIYINNSIIADSPVVVSSIIDLSTNPDNVCTWVNGIENATGTLVNNTNSFGNRAFYVGTGYTHTSLFFGGYIPELIVYMRDLSDAERVKVENNITGGWLTTLEESVFDNNHDEGFADYTQRNPFSRNKFTTEATAFTIDGYTNDVTPYAAFPWLAVYVDGVYATTVKLETNNVRQSVSISGLAAGAKTIQIVNGPEWGATAPVQVTQAQKIRLWGSASIISATEPARRGIVFGDSLSMGNNCATPITQAWTMLLRADYDGLAVDGWSGRSLYDMGQTAADRATYVSNMVAHFPSPEWVWLAIGTNDHGLQRWSSTDFGVAFGDFVTRLQAAYPTVPIFAKTMIHRSNEAELVTGWGTLGAYRTAMTNSATGIANVTVVDGTGAEFAQVGDLADGVHPTAAGEIIEYTGAKLHLGALVT